MSLRVNSNNNKFKPEHVFVGNVFFDEQKEQNEIIWCLPGQKLHVLYIICLLIIWDAVVGEMLVCEREQTMWKNHTLVVPNNFERTFTFQHNIWQFYTESKINLVSRKSITWSSRIPQFTGFLCKWWNSECLKVSICSKLLFQGEL